MTGLEVDLGQMRKSGRVVVLAGLLGVAVPWLMGLGVALPFGYPTVEAIVRMGKKLEAATNGRLSIQMFPSMQLGGEKEMIEQAQIGALQIARISGAGTLIMLGTDVDAHRLEVAQELGAHHALNVQRDDVAGLLRGLGDGFGADVVVDCTGVSAALKQAMELVRPLGTVVKIGWGPQPLNFSLDPLVAKAATLQGSFSHTYATWERVLQLMATGQLNLDPMIGGVYPLAEWEAGFHAMEVGENVKSVLMYD